MAWWHARLREAGQEAGIVLAEPALRDGRLTLEFEDPEGQRLALVDDGGTGPEHPWDASPVPAAYQIRGLGPIRLSVPDPARTAAVLTDLLGMRRERSFETGDGPVAVYAMGPGGPAAEIQLLADAAAPAQQGAGAVHHVAFRIPDAEYEAWADRLKAARVPSSGPVDRYYFRSLYFPRAQRHPVRDRHRRPGLHRRRAPGEPGRAPRPAAVPGTAPGRDRGGVEAAPSGRRGLKYSNDSRPFTSCAGVILARLDGRAATAKEAPEKKHPIWV